MIVKIKILILFSLLTIFYTLEVQACHKFSLTYGRMYVSSEMINIDLKVPIEDLILFRYLPVDSSRDFSIDEINKAGEKYVEEIREALSLSTESGLLAIHEIRLQSFQTQKVQELRSTNIQLSKLNEHHLSFSISYKRLMSHGLLTVEQNFGMQYPLIPSLMVLDVDGLSDERLTCKLAKGIGQTLGSEALNSTMRNQILVTFHENSQLLSFSFKVNDLMDILKINQVDQMSTLTLKRLFEISKNGQVLDVEITDLKWTEKQRGLRFDIQIDHSPQQHMALKWTKFSRSLRKISLSIDGEADTQDISRFNDSVTWSN